MIKCRKVTEHEALKDITPSHAPPGVLQTNWNRSRPQGQQSSALGWYRGKHAGYIEAVLALQEMGHTRIAAKLQKHLGLSDEGTIG